MSMDVTSCVKFSDSRSEYMKIDNRVAEYLSLIQGTAVHQAVSDSNTTSEEKETVRDAVEFSAAAVNLADDEARRERLNRIRQQLAEGSYNISGKDVADKMLKALKN